MYAILPPFLFAIGLYAVGDGVDMFGGVGGVCAKIACDVKDRRCKVVLGVLAHKTSQGARKSAICQISLTEYPPVKLSVPTAAGP